MLQSAHDHTQQQNEWNDETFDWSEINVNPRTGLAADYLNHYVELSLQLEMLSAMPDFFDTIKLWQPIDYQNHVKKTGLKHAEAVLYAYSKAEPACREALDKVRERHDKEILTLIGEIGTAYAQDDTPVVAETARKACATTQSAIQQLNRVLNLGAEAV